jgi:ubiquinone/menaquinone biosynthesis C-methylase UbiE
LEELLKTQNFSKKHYAFDKYINKQRWMSFYYQLSEITKRNPSSILEIGIGSGVLGTLLMLFGFHYESADNDESLNPCYLASVLSIPLPDEKYDLVCSFQTLEHLPYENFIPALKEMRRLTKKYVLLSLPDYQVCYPYSIYIPRYGSFNFNIPKPILKKHKHKFDGKHHWEINTDGYELSRIKSDIISSELNIDYTYNSPEFPYHRFFCLSKK